MYEAICPNLSGRPFISPSVLSIASAVFFALCRTRRRASSSSSSVRRAPTARRTASAAIGKARGARAPRRARRPRRETGGALARGAGGGATLRRPLGRDDEVMLIPVYAHRRRAADQPSAQRAPRARPRRAPDLTERVGREKETSACPPCRPPPTSFSRACSVATRSSISSERAGWPRSTWRVRRPSWAPRGGAS